MNAHAPTLARVLTPLALENAPILRRIGTAEPPIVTVDGLAEAESRDPSNFRKTLKRLEADGLIVRDGGPHPCGLGLTPGGARALALLDMDDGRELGAGGDLQPVTAETPTWAHDKLQKNPENPRQNFDSDDLAGLADTIKGVGVLFPLIVTPPDLYGVRTIRDGDRRWLAVAELIKAGDLPADHPMPIREVEPTPGEAAFIALVTTNREPLTTLEDAIALETLSRERGWSARETATRIGRRKEGSEAGVRTVQERIQVIRDADPEDVAACRAGKLTWEELRLTVREQKEAKPDNRASNTYLASLDYPTDGLTYRTPAGPPIHALVRPGTVVTTSYGSGPYHVHQLSGPHTFRPKEGGEFAHWSLILSPIRDFDPASSRFPKGDHFINEVVAVNGRLLHLFENNDDEVLIQDFDEMFAKQAELKALAAEPRLVDTPPRPAPRGGSFSSPAPPERHVVEGLTDHQMVRLYEIAEEIRDKPVSAAGHLLIVLGRQPTLIEKALEAAHAIVIRKDAQLPDPSLAIKITEAGRAWLEENPDPTIQVDLEEAVGKGREPTPEQPVNLSAKERCALIELAHKLGQTGGAVHGATTLNVEVGHYWMDLNASTLRDHRLLGFIGAKGMAWRAHITEAGWSWLSGYGYPGVFPTDADLDAPRFAVLGDLRLAEAYRTEGRYLTPWLNPLPDVPAGDATPPATGPSPAEDHEEEPEGDGDREGQEDNADPDLIEAGTAVGALMREVVDSLPKLLKGLVDPQHRTPDRLAFHAATGVRYGGTLTAVLALALLRHRHHAEAVKLLQAAFGEAAAAAVQGAEAPLLAIRKGDVVHKGTEATSFQVLERVEDGPHTHGQLKTPTFKVQTRRHGRNYGTPVKLTLGDIVGFNTEAR